jgi:pimeloyl-ACP methyl ester carboxylesterase
MKKSITILSIALLALAAKAQNIVGQWNGVLKVQGVQLRIVFHINKTDSGYNATMDSPDQGAKGIPVTTTSFADMKLKLTVAKAGIEYEGMLGKDNRIVGDFRQGGQSFPMDLSTQPIEKQQVVRPQTPSKPYPYYAEDLTFENKKARITLAGTLTLPKKDGIFPAVVLITGSGAQNRDEELLGHKPFLVLADYLTKNGIAVLRFDDRGTAASTGNFKTATTLDFSTDVEAAVNYLQTRKEINKNKIGLVGHSEGGMIAPMVASKSKDIGFIVLLAGPGIDGAKLLLLQERLIGKAAGESDSNLAKASAINRGAFDLVVKSTDIQKLKTDLTNYLKEAVKNNPSAEKPKNISEDDYIKSSVNQLANPWMQYFLKYNPAPVLEKVKCPVLAIDGSKDLQVPATINLAAIKKALEKGGNKNVTTKELPNLNHLFQECQTGSPSEYAAIEQTFSPIALQEITRWILGQTK